MVSNKKIDGTLRDEQLLISAFKRILFSLERFLLTIEKSLTIAEAHLRKIGYCSGKETVYSTIVASLPVDNAIPYLSLEMFIFVWLLFTSQ